MKNVSGLVAGLVAAAIGGAYLTDAQDAGHTPKILGNMDTMNASLTALPDHELPEVKPTEVVVLQDGDTFDLEATIVQQHVGNRVVKRLAYNGQIPGPVIKVERGSKVTVNFTNNIDLETSVHSHGLRGNWLFDGAVPLTPAVQIGETFSYELEFPDTGVFWYHPHVREDYQQEMGLYGNMIVEEPGYWSDADMEVYLIVDDILEDGDFKADTVTRTLMGRFGNRLLINDSDDFNLSVKAGEITRAFITNVANTRTFDLQFEGAMTKRVGSDIGRIEREEMIDHQIIAPAERYVLELYYSDAGTFPIMHRGQQIGTVSVEASGADRRADFHQLRENLGDYAEIRAGLESWLAQVPDKSLRLDIEMDGMMGGQMQMGEGPSVEHCQQMPNMAGCAEVLAAAGTMEGMSEGGHDMSNMSGESGEQTMAMGEGPSVEHCQQMPNMAGCAEVLAAAGTMEGMSEGGHDMSEMQGMMGHMSPDGIEWEDDMAAMNAMSNDHVMRWVIEDMQTGAKNHEIDWNFGNGDLVKVRIFNDDSGMHPMQHPIHFHGQRFLVLAQDGVANDNLQWKDTVLIPMGRTFDILVDMSNPGKWMAHCHIAEHLGAGMMFKFEVHG